MKYTQVKAVRKLCDNLFSTPDYREVIGNMVCGKTDFEVDNVRFISDDVILKTLADEIGSDEYCLGCFNASFLSDVLGVDQDVIKAMQKAEAFEAVGKLVKSLGKLAQVSEDYASADGFGHHFNSYDFGEDEIKVAGVLYHVFDNH
jgi:hypothetical protein